ncbi:MAG: hypothetical protein A3H97_19100 [Acidobacteria bacterium RIFCSPLOWO2_02_FULL_65_29]|nr:MAG: hypothetical protein A3H97_19100 [Acidobacteria bacterium RIFCSPLOWO2_02_FULL_65_29]
MSMRRRLLESLGVAVAMAALVTFLQLTAAGQAPAARGTAASAPAPKTTWGHPDLQGIWLDEFDTPLERGAKYANREFFSDEERAAQDDVRSGNVGRNLRAEVGSRQDVAGAYNAVFTSAKPAGRRTSLVVEPANGRIPALTPRVQEQNRLDREFRLALLQNTDTCKDKMTACNGWQYGPPSPRRAEVAPFYNTQRMNRHNGPEDQSLGDRCMLGATPDFNGFRRIVQGQDSIAIGVDTGQGQGYQRVVYLSGSHPPSSIRLRHGDSRGRFEGNTLVVDTTNFSPKFPFRGAAENLKLVERFTRVDANTMEYAATITDPTVWTAPWTVKQELTMQRDDQNRIYYEPRCHEGNYGLPALLIGARMDDKAFAEGRGADPASQDTASCLLNPDEPQ